MDAEAELAPRPPVGFIGLGQLGTPIARRLRAAGNPLVVTARTSAKAELLMSEGATWADSPKAVGRAVSGGVVFLCLTDAKAVRSVLFGRGGVASGAKTGTLVVDLSTIAPDESRAIAERLGRRGIHFLDAPVGGSVDTAGQGRLLLFVGGEAADVERARPLLQAFGRRIERLGPHGAGASMKLVNNLVTVTTLALDAEALALADGFGLVRSQVLDLLLDGGGRSAMLERYRPRFEERRYPSQFRLPLARKDLGLIERAGRGVGRASRLGREARRLLDVAIAAGHGTEDVSAVFEVALARDGGAPAPGAPAPPPTPSPSPDGRTPP